MRRPWATWHTFSARTGSDAHHVCEHGARWLGNPQRRSVVNDVGVTVHHASAGPQQ